MACETATGDLGSLGAVGGGWVVKRTKEKERERERKKRASERDTDTESAAEDTKDQKAPYTESVLRALYHVFYQPIFSRTTVPGIPHPCTVQ